MSKAWERLDEMGRAEIVNKAIGAYHEDEEIIDMVARELAEFDPVITAAMDRITDAQAAVEREKQRTIGLCALRLEADITHALHERLVRAWLTVVEMAVGHARRAEAAQYVSIDRTESPWTALSKGPRFGEWTPVGTWFVSPCGRVGTAPDIGRARASFARFQEMRAAWGYEAGSDDARRIMAGHGALALYDARFGTAPCPF